MKRIFIQVEVGAQFKEAVQAIADREMLTLSQVARRALIETHPELKEIYINEMLERRKL